jgi:serine protease inhibitor
MPNTYTTFAASANAFGFRLLQQLSVAQPGATLLLSPFSIAAALAMTYNGAAGATATEMAAVLGWQDRDLAALNAGAQALIAELLAADPAVTLHVANALWPDDAFALNPAFTAQVGAAYHAAVQRIDYADPAVAADAINAWVAAQTAHMITNLLAPTDLANAVMALVNAIYFKGAWSHPFDPRLTTPRPFHKADGVEIAAPFMQQMRRWQYAVVDEVGLVWLPFGAGRLGMVLALPPAALPLADFQARVDADTWARWLDASAEELGTVTLPRLTVRAHFDLAATLQHMGMALAFTGAADFSHMGDGPLLISKVVHEAALEVNEIGAEAAAATAVVMGRSIPHPRFHLVFDRPFFCAIYDLQTSAILFAGHVCAPE